MDISHEISGQEAEVTTERFIHVDPDSGRGNYSFDPETGRYYPDPENGSYIRIRERMGKFQHILSLDVRGNFSFYPGRLTTFRESFLKIFGLESIFRLEDETSYPGRVDVALLKPGVILDEKTTIQGKRTIQNDLLLFPESAGVNVRLRDIRGFSMDNRSGDYHKKRNSFETSFRSRWSELGSFDLEIQGMISGQREKVKETGEFEQKNQGSVKILTGKKLTSQWKGLLDFEFRRQTFEDVSIKDTLYTVTLEPGARRSFPGKGSLEARVEFEYLKSPSDHIPLYYTLGKNMGLSSSLKVNLDYRLGKYLTLSFDYSLINEPSKDMIQRGKAELSAYF